MSVKRELIRILEENRGQSVSGERLAGELGVTRAAVWKAVQSLKAEGYRIDSGKNRGYCLSGENDKLSAEGIRLGLPEEYRTAYIEVMETVDSTNNYAKRLLSDGLFRRNKELRFGIIAANAQTAGRGRLGRSFYSPADTGIYMTLILRADRKITEFLPVTVAAAVAVTRAIESFSDETPKIKWVNDIWLGKKKVCGILSEGISDFESGTLEAAVVGIGINVSQAPELPEELQKIAASVDSLHVTRNELIAAITKELFLFSENFDAPELMREYREKSLILGREIYWDTAEGRRFGRAFGINDTGNLMVETDGGTVVLNSGEVSIRPV